MCFAVCVFERGGGREDAVWLDFREFGESRGFVYGSADEAKLDGVTFRSLRHSAGGLMRKAGVHTQVIQQRLGHASSRTTTDIYGWVPDETDRAAATSLNDLFAMARGLDEACDDHNDATA